MQKLARAQGSTASLTPLAGSSLLATLPTQAKEGAAGVDAHLATAAAPGS